MATPVRRSARLRTATPVTEPAQNNTPKSSNRLSSVPERDSQPKSPSKVDSVSATPKGHTASTPSATGAQSKKIMKTPTTTGFLKPGLEEMHPSKVQQSTSKQPDSGLRLGFKPIQTGKQADPASGTPTKARLSQSGHADSSSFDFKFSCEDSQLSLEAKKLMDNIREDAARIKAQMVIEQSAQNRKDAEAERFLFGPRKIAKAKGKAGRFSDAHMAEFKKMDSIAGHPSSFRARTDYPAPATKSLKRTISKACLDEPPKTPSSAKTSSASTPKVDLQNSAKRSKNTATDDASSRRPMPNDVQAESSKPARRQLSTIPTPNRPTTARPSSVKLASTTKIPSLPRSPSMKSINAPRTPQTEFNPKLKSGLPSLGNLKSILRRRQPLFSNDPIKIAAGTHVAAPATSSRASISLESPSPKKRVDFSASTKLRHALASTPSHSTVSSAIPSNTAADPGAVEYPALPQIASPAETKSARAAKTLSPTIRTVPSPSVLYRRPSLPNRSPIPHGITNKKRHRDEVDDEDTENRAPNVPQDERTPKRTKIAPAVTPTTAPKPRTPSPVKRSMNHVTRGRGTPSSSGQKSGGFLSRNRLNMLSMPKQRR